MKKILIIVFAFVTTLSVFAQNSFEKYYSGGTSVEGFHFTDAEELPTGGFFGVGNLKKYNEASRLVVFKTTSTGDTLWTKTYFPITSTRAWWTKASCLAADGGLLVLLGNYYNDGNTSSNYNSVIKFNSTGDTLWTTTITASSSWAQEHMIEIKSTPDGGCVAFGAGSYFPTPLMVVKVNAAGQVEWSNGTFPANNNSYNQFNGGCVAADGTIFATGKHGDAQVIVSKISSSGSEKWSKLFFSGSYTGADTTKGEGFGVTATTDGGCVITGYASRLINGGSTKAAFVMKVDSAGNKLWYKEFLYKVNYGSHGKFITNNGSGFITYISTHDGYTDDNPHLISLNENGDSLWSQKGYYQYFGHSTKPNMICADGSIVFTGSTNPDQVMGLIIRTTTGGLFRSPQPFFPYNTSTNQNLNLPLVWTNNSHYASSYKAEVSEDSLFNTVYLVTNSTNNDTAWIGGLLSNKKYFWRIRSIDATGAYSPWSSVYSFVTGNNVSINEFSNNPLKLQVYPNPCTNQLNLSVPFNAPQETYVLNVLEVTGHLIENVLISKGENWLQTEHWASGIYFIHCSDKNGILQSVHKVIRN